MACKSGMNVLSQVSRVSELDDVHLMMFETCIYDVYFFSDYVLILARASKVHGLKVLKKIEMKLK